MKILSAQQLKEADLFTIKNEPISSIDLMERAANACVGWLTNKYDTSFNFIIFCGLGNNGGDGLAIARMLIEKTYKVSVYIINHSPKRSEDFLVNYERLKKITNTNLTLEEIDSVEQLSAKSALNSESIIVDAIFGSGLNKPVEGFCTEVVNFINPHLLPVISIDIPSGLFCDVLNETKGSIVHANYTLTFQFPKRSFMFPENAPFVGDFSVLDIGLHSDYIDNAVTKNYFIVKSDIQLFLKKRAKAAHKGNFGHALLLAGSYGKMGAAVLSSKACMHSGAGLLTVHIPKAGYEIMQTSLPEAMVSVDSNSNYITDNLKLDKYDAIGIGPGIGTDKETQNVVKVLIQNSTLPIVFDADAINILSENKTWLSFIPANSIFTPHPKEFERLVGKTKNSEERIQKQREFSFKYNAYLVLKGAHTSISCPNGDVFYNSTGNPGMATGGSGDVLTGIITSFIAQGYTSQQACLLGVYIHGLAGDFAAVEKSEESMIASDIIENISEAFQFLHAKKLDYFGQY